MAEPDRLGPKRAGWAALVRHLEGMEGRTAMTLRKRIVRLEETSPAHQVAVVAPKGLVERLTAAFIDSQEDHDIREIFDAWKKEQGKT